MVPPIAQLVSADTGAVSETALCCSNLRNLLPTVETVSMLSHREARLHEEPELFSHLHGVGFLFFSCFLFSR